jgi:hypothetical protein
MQPLFHNSAAGAPKGGVERAPSFSLALLAVASRRG